MSQVLKATELLPDYPFSHLHHSKSDKQTMLYMLDQVKQAILQHGEDTLEILTPAGDNWQYRLIIPQAQRLISQTAIQVVGFFGLRKPSGDAKMMNDFDKILVTELPRHLGILCYFSMGLLSGNYCNLVLFDDNKVKEGWAKSEAHNFATRHLAPHYYSFVRIHNAMLKSLEESEGLELNCTKYFSYTPTPWQGIRYYHDPVSPTQPLITH
ncbi:MAG: hypothetical protein R2880_04120 [Deinococcales bacterium]